MSYKLYTSLKETRGLDGEVNLTLRVKLRLAPIWLSEFTGGCGKIYDGYSLGTRLFNITSDSDGRRLKLLFDDGGLATLSPEFVRSFNPDDPLNQLQAIPLRIGQTLLLAYKDEALAKEYIITGSNWWA